MESTPNYWIIVGSTDYSERFLDVRPAPIPLAHLMPASAISKRAGHLYSPANIEKCSIVAGVAVEVSDRCKNVDEKRALECIGGYRLWIALHSKFLIEQLSAQKNQIRIWDHGINLFYGFWMTDSHIVSNRIDAGDWQRLRSIPLELEAGGSQKTNGVPEAYRFAPTTVISFFSRFMTLNTGDLFVLGPICGLPLINSGSKVRLSWSEITCEVSLDTQ